MPTIPVPQSDKHPGVKITVLNKDGSESEAWTLDGIAKTLEIHDRVWDAAHKVVSQFIGHNGKVDPKSPVEVLKEKKDVEPATVPTPVEPQPASRPAPSADPVGTGTDARQSNEPPKRERQTRQPKAKPVGQPPADVSQTPVVVTDAVTAEVAPAVPPAEEKATE